MLGFLQLIAIVLLSPILLPILIIVAVYSGTTGFWNFIFRTILFAIVLIVNLFLLIVFWPLGAVTSIIATLMILNEASFF